jgi:hypothetical protein
MQNLSLQICQIDEVIINQGKAADTGAGKIQSGRRAKATGTDDQNFGFSNFFWPSMPICSSRIWRE